MQRPKTTAIILSPKSHFSFRHRSILSQKPTGTPNVCKTKNAIESHEQSVDWSTRPIRNWRVRGSIDRAGETARLSTFSTCGTKPKFASAFHSHKSNETIPVDNPVYSQTGETYMFYYSCRERVSGEDVFSFQFSNVHRRRSNLSALRYSLSVYSLDIQLITVPLKC